MGKKRRKLDSWRFFSKFLLKKIMKEGRKNKENSRLLKFCLLLTSSKQEREAIGRNLLSARLSSISIVTPKKYFECINLINLLVYWEIFSHDKNVFINFIHESTVQQYFYFANKNPNQKAPSRQIVPEIILVTTQ